MRWCGTRWRGSAGFTSSSCARPCLSSRAMSRRWRGPVDRTEVAARSSLDLPAASALAAVFMPTRAYRRALGVLDRHRFAVLSGPPEVGKTAIARTIALAQLTDGWE